MGALSDKIQSYAVEVYRPYTDSTVSTSATKFGTITSDTISITASGQFSVQASGPVTETQSSWQLTQITGQSAARVNHNNSTFLASVNDHDFVVGIWFRYTTFPFGTSGTTQNVILSGGSIVSGNSGFNVFVPSSGNSNFGRIGIQTNGAVTYSSAGTISDDSEWHYIAVKRTSSSYEVFFDGNSVVTASNSNTQTFASIGYGGPAAFPNSAYVIQIGHSHFAPTSVLTNTAIGEIWTAGSSVAGTDVTINEAPATASALLTDVAVTGNANITENSATATALQTEPTIAVETGDHTEITTSILVSALMAPATVSTQTFINLVATPGTAYSELINNIVVGSSNSVDFGAQEFLAFAELVEPFLAEEPMTATAVSGNHTVFVTPNYFNLVKSKNPLFYFNYDSSTITNFGSWQNVTYAIPSTTYLDRSELSGGDMGLVGAGRSWMFLGTNSSLNKYEVIPENKRDTLYNLCIQSRAFTVEFWTKSSSTVTLGNLTITGPSFTVSSLARPLYNSPSSLTYSFTSNYNAVVRSSDWNHVVLSVAPRSASGVDYDGYAKLGVGYALYLNGVYLGGVNTELADNYSASANYEHTYRSSVANTLIDETAIYPITFNNSDILDNFNFINNLDPNRNIFVDPFEASATSGTHVFTVTSNANPEIKEATASAIAVTPTLIAGRSFTHNANAFAASSTIVQPGLSLGNTRTATPITAYAESVNAFALNSIYYDYVQANIMPYRYVTFDAANVYADYGTDNDYAVQPTVVGGAIVNPDEGISGKSAKTAGINYATDGVILKESEYNDTWGTGLNRYHSSFWIQKADEDVSTGLRVVWNLNGYYDNQHVILYQYQGKLRLNFNNGSGTFIEQTTVNNIDLFDGNRHFVLIDFDHTGVNSSVYLYVDAVLVMTVNLGTYSGTTINGVTPVGANDELNNHPRLSVGCLITPFASTSLPVVPTNTRIIADEIIWAKTAINQAGVTALFNIMPDKNNADEMADPMTASALAVNPLISTSANYPAAPAVASALISDSTVTADRNIVVASDFATASAEMLEALRVDNVVISSDIMVATAIFNDAGVRITIPGGPMIASAVIADSPFESDPTNNYFGGVTVITNVTGRNASAWYVLSPWATYLRATDINSILPMKEIN